MQGDQLIELRQYLCLCGGGELHLVVGQHHRKLAAAIVAADCSYLAVDERVHQDLPARITKHEKVEADIGVEHDALSLYRSEGRSRFLYHSENFSIYCLYCEVDSGARPAYLGTNRSRQAPNWESCSC